MEQSQSCSNATAKLCQCKTNFLNALQRAWNFTSGKESFQEVFAKDESPSELTKNLLVYLCAISPLLTYLIHLIFGMTAPFVGTIRPHVVWGLLYYAAMYLVSIATVYIAAKIFTFFARPHKADVAERQLFQLLTFALMPTLLAGCISWLPLVGILAGLAALVFTVVLLKRGSELLLGISGGDTWKFLGLSIICTILAGMVISLILFTILPSPYPAINPGSITPEQIKQMEDAARELQKFLPRS